MDTFSPANIRIEIETMKQYVSAYLSENNARVEALCRESIDKFFADDSLRSLINAAVVDVIDQKTRQIVSDYFTRGDGAIGIQAYLQSMMKRQD